jgi:hypothetical protein
VGAHENGFAPYDPLIMSGRMAAVPSQDRDLGCTIVEITSAAFANMVGLIKAFFKAVAKTGHPVLWSTLAVTAIVATVSTSLLVARSRQVETELPGGLDLVRYCNSFGFSQNSDKLCFSPLDVNMACNWHYHRGDLHMRFTSNSPISGACFTPQNQAINGSNSGVDDLPEYCQRLYNSTSDVTATPMRATNWVCEKTINMKAACIWKANRTNVVAREVSNGNWRCFVR